MKEKLKQPDKKYIFTKGIFGDITNVIKKNKDISAVFLNVDILTTLQLKTLQEAWRLPVYDRSV